MHIPSAKFILPLPISMPREQLLQNLKPGQILQATVLSENQNGSVKLQIGVTRLIAQTRISVKQGQVLTLQVHKAGDLPELKLLTLPTLQQIQAKALKAILPRQQPIPPLLEKLVQSIGMSGNSAPPSEVKQAFNSLVSRLLATENPEFKGLLKAALLNSGLLTEARLLSNSTNNGDLKLNLMRLIRLLQASSGAQVNAKTPPSDPTVKFLNDLLKQLDGVLARIQTNQLASLPQDDPARQNWQFEAPILHENKIDLLQVLIEKDQASKSNEETSTWTLTLQMNLSALGPMRIQLTLQGDVISTVIWAERSNTNNLVKSHLKTLHKAFETAGLEVKKLEIYQARIEQRDPMPRDISLLSEKA